MYCCRRGWFLIFTHSKYKKTELKVKHMRNISFFIHVVSVMDFKFGSPCSFLHLLLFGQNKSIRHSWCFKDWGQAVFMLGLPDYIFMYIYGELFSQYWHMNTRANITCTYSSEQQGNTDGRVRATLFFLRDIFTYIIFWWFTETFHQSSNSSLHSTSRFSFFVVTCMLLANMRLQVLINIVLSPLLKMARIVAG